MIVNSHSHITEKSIRRRYGRSEENVRAFVHNCNRLGHRGTTSQTTYERC